MDAENARTRILIVDDEQEVRSVLCSALCDKYLCTESGSAEDALSLLQVETFDLVISDINLGGMSGFEMIPHVLASAPDTVVVMISGQDMIESAIEALRLGVFDYIVKPFDLLHVEAAVERAITHHSLLQTKRRHENHLEDMVKQSTAELNHQALHDALTDLPNRVLFEDRLRQALAHSERRKNVAMIFLSLDRFKKVDDTLGHQLGNCLLRDAAKRLTSTLHKDATIARFEGDEFALLLTYAADSEIEAVIHTVHEISEAFKVPFVLDDHEVFVTTSIGISLYPDDGTDAATLLKNAGAALYRAKEKGGNNYQFYTADMNVKALKRLRLEGKLRRALERSEFEVHYQPQLDVRSGKVVGMEALVRWRHPEQGLISPIEFIPLAEDTGLIVSLGEWVLYTACAQSKKWQEEGFGQLSLAVNLSARQFHQSDLPSVIARILRETGLDPHFLELELTESSIMVNTEVTIQALSDIKSIGVRVALDDFGTGYSSLGYLKRLPIDVLKIDSSFVRDVTSNPDDAALVLAIITLAHNLRLLVTAEGVETVEQLELLAQLGCDMWQGYLFSKPLPAPAFREFLTDRQHANFESTFAGFN